MGRRRLPGQAQGRRDPHCSTGGGTGRCVVFESTREKELVFSHKTTYDGLIIPSEELDGGRFWSLEEIRSNIGKEIFTPNFENEFKKLGF